MTIQSELFETLGAPLNNVRWSWGGVRDTDGTVFLRVWQDGTIKRDGKRYLWVSDVSPPDGDLGAHERLGHVKQVLDGALCYLVMCQAVDTKAASRVVQSFNAKQVFLAGEIIEIDGLYWIEVKERKRIREVIA